MTFPHEHFVPSHPKGQMHFYVSGPMTGQPRFNFDAFDRARDLLRALGHAATSPADHDRQVYPDIESNEGFAEGRLTPGSPRFEDMIGWDLQFIASIECDAILFLPGWERSRGARHERNTAEACGRRIFYVDEPFTCIYEERPTRIIGVSGYAQAGKDTIASILVGLYGFERIAFADALKAVLADTDPIVCSASDESLTGSLLANLVNGGWEQAKENTNAREYLQRLGVAVREHVDPDAWVNAAFRKVKPGGAYVISDLRFPNEYDAVRARGGDLWRVTRPFTKPVNAHVSETALDEHKFDHWLHNFGTIDDLTDQVSAALFA